MKESFDKGFKLVIGLEGKLSTDPRDPGNYYPDGRAGFTIWGLCTLYNEGLSKDMTLEQVKEIYYKKYWVPAGCNEVPYPMDICLFDSNVNPQNDPRLPGGGNKEILLQNPKNWEQYNILRMIRYMRNSKEKYVKGHIFRVLKLSEELIKEVL